MCIESRSFLVNTETNFLPDPARPLMMIRLRIGHEEPEIWRRTFEQLKKVYENAHPRA